MMIVGAALNSLQVVQLGNQVRLISASALPIAYKAAQLNEFGLRRRIAFERLSREYQLSIKDSSVITEAEVNFEKFTSLTNENVAELLRMLSTLPENQEDQELYAQARVVASHVQLVFSQQTDIARIILSKNKTGEVGSSIDLLAINLAMQTSLQVKRSELQAIAAGIAENSVNRAKIVEKRVLLSSLSVTILAVLVGLTGAWVLSKRLASPIRMLVKSAKDVQCGNLSVIIEGLPEDEIGELGDTMNRMIVELRRKQNLQALMSTYIDPRVVEMIILPGRVDVLAGQKQTMTILFCDIVGFTEISEQLSPNGLVKMVNRYFTIMTECIKAEGGIIDKFIGDAIMAYWGPPFIAEGEQAAAACRAAIRMSKALEEFSLELPDVLGLRKNVPEINIRIGLATGEVVVGNIGSDTACSFTVMGDVVNLASRLESANKQYGTTVIISEATMRMADVHIEAVELDRIVVKGKTETVEIYELLSLRGELSHDQQARRERFNDAIAAYRLQDWIASKAIFSELVERFGDKTAAIFIERIILLEKHGLGEGWDGVWRLTNK